MLAVCCETSINLAVASLLYSWFCKFISYNYWSRDIMFSMITFYRCRAIFDFLSSLNLVFSSLYRLKFSFFSFIQFVLFSKSYYFLAWTLSQSQWVCIVLAKFFYAFRSSYSSFLTLFSTICLSISFSFSMSLHWNFLDGFFIWISSIASTVIWDNYFDN